MALNNRFNWRLRLIKPLSLPLQPFGGAQANSKFVVKTDFGKPRWWLTVIKLKLG
jgi:hypothetical protein